MFTVFSYKKLDKALSVDNRRFTFPYWKFGKVSSISRESVSSVGLLSINAQGKKSNQAKLAKIWFFFYESE